uniref:J domain-containing protein n=1 Tax=Chromera velia CCMP2878 TaxID=1169474 RepID=A0A0G4IET0_9ALVE|eukprot:Cvel_2431.t1-p1 / transcript=Cvel_2431.t1 / gene=Cvel_2431 / organism=Chromera_velia_CCMP2878 / gene_product=hypothetical protein / transcript_product=hypothetical protein / location=Cvel_scaffold95:55934-67638(+) / protein_length=2111 / sequence_SO=supercontig / SO=protein_coding / is_pseudo=false
MSTEDPLCSQILECVFRGALPGDVTWDLKIRNVATAMEMRNPSALASLKKNLSTKAAPPGAAPLFEECVRPTCSLSSLLKVSCAVLGTLNSQTTETKMEIARWFLSALETDAPSAKSHQPPPTSSTSPKLRSSSLYGAAWNPGRLRPPTSSSHQSGSSTRSPLVSVLLDQQGLHSVSESVGAFVSSTGPAVESLKEYLRGGEEGSEQAVGVHRALLEDFGTWARDVEVEMQASKEGGQQGWGADDIDLAIGARLLGEDGGRDRETRERENRKDQKREPPSVPLPPFAEVWSSLMRGKPADLRADMQVRAEIAALETAFEEAGEGGEGEDDAKSERSCGASESGGGLFETGGGGLRSQSQSSSSGVRSGSNGAAGLLSSSVEREREREGKPPPPSFPPPSCKAFSSTAGSVRSEHTAGGSSSFSTCSSSASASASRLCPSSVGLAMASAGFKGVDVESAVCGSLVGLGSSLKKGPAPKAKSENDMVAGMLGWNSGFSNPLDLAFLDSLPELGIANPTTRALVQKFQDAMEDCRVRCSSEQRSSVVNLLTKLLGCVEQRDREQRAREGGTEKDKAGEGSSSSSSSSSSPAAPNAANSNSSSAFAVSLERAERAFAQKARKKVRELARQRKEKKEAARKAQREATARAARKQERAALREVKRKERIAKLEERARRREIKEERKRIKELQKRKKALDKQAERLRKKLRDKSEERERELYMKAAEEKRLLSEKRDKDLCPKLNFGLGEVRRVEEDLLQKERRAEAAASLFGSKASERVAALPPKKAPAASADERGGMPGSSYLLSRDGSTSVGSTSVASRLSRSLGTGVNAQTGTGSGALEEVGGKDLGGSLGRSGAGRVGGSVSFPGGQLGASTGKSVYTGGGPSSVLFRNIQKPSSSSALETGKWSKGGVEESSERGGRRLGGVSLGSVSVLDKDREEEEEGNEREKGCTFKEIEAERNPLKRRQLLEDRRRRMEASIAGKLADARAAALGVDEDLDDPKGGGRRSGSKEGDRDPLFRVHKSHHPIRTDSIGGLSSSDSISRASLLKSQQNDLSSSSSSSASSGTLGEVRRGQWSMPPPPSAFQSQAPPSGSSAARSPLSGFGRRLMEGQGQAHQGGGEGSGRSSRGMAVQSRREGREYGDVGDSVEKEKKDSWLTGLSVEEEEKMKQQFPATFAFLSGVGRTESGSSIKGEGGGSRMHSAEANRREGIEGRAKERGGTETPPFLFLSSDEVSDPVGKRRDSLLNPPSVGTRRGGYLENEKEKEREKEKKMDLDGDLDPLDTLLGLRKRLDRIRLGRTAAEGGALDAEGGEKDREGGIGSRGSTGSGGSAEGILQFDRWMSAASNTGGRPPVPRRLLGSKRVEELPLGGSDAADDLIDLMQKHRMEARERLDGLEREREIERERAKDEARRVSMFVDSPVDGDEGVKEGNKGRSSHLDLSDLHLDSEEDENKEGDSDDDSSSSDEDDHLESILASLGGIGEEKKRQRRKKGKKKGEDSELPSWLRFALGEDKKGRSQKAGLHDEDENETDPLRLVTPSSVLSSASSQSSSSSSSTPSPSEDELARELEGLSDPSDEEEEAAGGAEGAAGGLSALGGGLLGGDGAGDSDEDEGGQEEGEAAPVDWQKTLERALSLLNTEGLCQLASIASAFISFCEKTAEAIERTYRGLEFEVALAFFGLERLPKSKKELRRRFLELSLKLHPDKNPNADAQAAEDFQMLQVYKEQLDNEIERRERWGLIGQSEEDANASADCDSAAAGLSKLNQHLNRCADSMQQGFVFDIQKDANVLNTFMKMAKSSEAPKDILLLLLITTRMDVPLEDAERGENGEPVGSSEGLSAEEKEKREREAKEKEEAAKERKAREEFEAEMRRKEEEEEEEAKKKKKAGEKEDKDEEPPKETPKKEPPRKVPITTREKVIHAVHSSMPACLSSVQSIHARLVDRQLEIAQSKARRFLSATFRKLCASLDTFVKEVKQKMDKSARGAMEGGIGFKCRVASLALDLLPPEFLSAARLLALSEPGGAQKVGDVFEKRLAGPLLEAVGGGGTGAGPGGPLSPAGASRQRGGTRLTGGVGGTSKDRERAAVEALRERLDAWKRGMEAISQGREGAEKGGSMR